LLRSCRNKLSALTRRILLAGLLIFSLACAEQDQGAAVERRDGYIHARATRIADGDTLTVRTISGQTIRVRIAEIDAPEYGEPYSDRAREALNDLVWGEDLEIRLYDIDSYGRRVAHVFVGETDVGRTLVRDGLAVVFCRFATDPSLRQDELQARETGTGLWSQNKIPRGACDPTAELWLSLPEACGEKQYCNQMASCPEAVFYLRECGATQMDGDEDGIPCESSLCSR
jgi:endonuclease YncB( thermonuclease family)